MTLRINHKRGKQRNSNSCWTWNFMQSLTKAASRMSHGTAQIKINLRNSDFSITSFLKCFDIFFCSLPLETAVWGEVMLWNSELALTHRESFQFKIECTVQKMGKIRRLSFAWRIAESAKKLITVMGKCRWRRASRGKLCMLLILSPTASKHLVSVGSRQLTRERRWICLNRSFRD